MLDTRFFTFLVLCQTKSFTKTAEELHITQIITIHYFEYTNTYHFHGESHDFWEFLCVDKGEVTVTAGEKKLTLQQGQIIFHEPNEFHNVQANGKIAPNLVVISFSCDSSCMKQFRNRLLSTSCCLLQ